MKDSTKLSILSFIVNTIGFTLIVHYFGWKLALLILVLIFGNNLEQEARKQRNSGE